MNGKRNIRRIYMLMLYLLNTVSSYNTEEAISPMKHYDISVVNSKNIIQHCLTLREENINYTILGLPQKCSIFVE